MIALIPSEAAAVVPRAAATTLVLRDSDHGLEVLMVRRSLKASFMPGAYVFPGGAVDAADAQDPHGVCTESRAQLAERIGGVMQVGDAAMGFAVAALRECFEECGLWLGAGEGAITDAALQALRTRLHGSESMADLAASAALPLASVALQPWSRWVTPLGVAKRFDTLFFIARAPAGQTPEVDAGETTSLAWVHPRNALDEKAQDRFQMEFATLQTVASLLPFTSAGEALVFAGRQTLLPMIEPRLVLDPQRNVLAVLLPGQPGYNEAVLR